MTLPTEFPAWPKIYRLNRMWVATEKIDGTSGIVWVPEDATQPVLAGSHKRWLTVDADNFGFCRWVKDHEQELRGLGPGCHHGEWWGQGIQRRYDLEEKRFSLFNFRWGLPRPVHPQVRMDAPCLELLPTCCHAVPVLGKGLNPRGVAEDTIADLVRSGSRAAPGFMKPEGVVLFHEPSHTRLKVTVENDATPKGMENS